MIELLVARRLERVHLAALRIDARHHVLDRAVLAGRVHRLEHREHRPAVLRVELLLQCRTAARHRRRASPSPRPCRCRGRRYRPGSKSDRRNLSGLSMRKRLMSLASFMAPLHAARTAWQAHQRKRLARNAATRAACADARSAGAAHDMDVGKLRLRLARREMRGCARAARRRSRAPASTFISAMRWPSGVAIPAGCGSTSAGSRPVSSVSSRITPPSRSTVSPTMSFGSGVPAGK